MRHTEALEHEKLREPDSRCAGYLTITGTTFYADVNWTVVLCNHCGAELHLADGYRKHWWNYEVMVGTKLA